MLKKTNVGAFVFMDSKTGDYVLCRCRKFR